MSFLHEQIHGPRRQARAAPPVATGAGAWGEVIRRDGDSVYVDLDDDADRAYGPVPYLLLAGSAGDPAPGDPCFLHLDTDGEPAYAVVQR